MSRTCSWPRILFVLGLVTYHTTLAGETTQADLLAAVSSGDTPKVESLLKTEGATIDADVIQATATSTQRDAIFETFTKSGWHPDTYLGHMGTPLMVLIDNVDATRWLLSHGADPNYGQVGMTKPLDAAVLRSSSDCVKLLIEKGAEVKNRNALKTASYYGRLDMIETLLDAGADVNEIPDYPEMLESEREMGLGTALHDAARNGQVEAAKLLLEKGANKNTKDSLGKAPVEIAEENGHTAVAEYLNSLI